MSNSDRVQAWRKRAKLKIVEIAGGKCGICEYDTCISALEFHHLDPSEKDFAITGTRDTRRFELMVAEVRKCILICANCHREVHAGMIADNKLLDAKVFIEELAQHYLTETQSAKDKGKFKTK